MKPWKLSAGTAYVIGKKKIKSDALPTTAYIMLGEKCSNQCQFCAQSRESTSRADLLSRVTWPTFSSREAISGIENSYGEGTIKRACLQVVQSPGSWETTVGALDLLHDNSSVPICVSGYLDTSQQAEELVARGAERVCIALDAAIPEIYEKVKGGKWATRWNLLLECAQALPGRITTHLIVGLGESEEAMVERIKACIDRGIRVGLFAFTPVRGTLLERQLPPGIGQYRRIQIAHELLRMGYQESVISYHDGKISEFNLPQEELLKIVTNGQIYQTSGCDDCNRPYYNERPGGTIYNYPRPLTYGEVAKAIWECEIIRGEHDELANY